jgi:CubicO group peptidase (beta-lactamase class C family)
MSNPSRTLIIAVVFFAASMPSRSQPMNAKQMDELAGRAMKAFGVPGMALGVVKDGRLVYAKGYGVRSVDSSELVNTNTLFGIASVTKGFTAAALGILVDEGKVKWDDKVQEYIPEFAMYDPYVSREFTIRDLLVHHSGLARGAGEMMQDPSPTTFTTSDIIHSLRYFRPTSSFRTQFAYSNIMYIVAGELIARVSGMTWEKFISNRIFEPLQMDVSAPSQHLIGENRNVIEPHAEINGAVRVVNRDDDEVADPAGGIFSSVDDISRWVIMQMNDGKYGDGLKKRLFSQAVHDEMWTPQTIIPVTGSSVYNTHFGAYGLGWFLIDAAGHKEVFHTGGDTGMSSNVVMMPELRLGIIVLANEDNGIGVSVADQILDSYLNITGTDHVRERLDKQHARGLLNQQTAGQAGSELRTKNRPGDVVYSGVYTDNWFGDVFVTFEKGVLWLRSERSPSLAGPLLPLEGNEFAARWCNAVLSFELNQEGIPTRLTLKPLVKGSTTPYFGDLDFRRRERAEGSGSKPANIERAVP